MPPKTGNSGEEQFLAACFKNCVDKPKVDYNKLALATGMSAGGAANKFRAIMKKWEDDGDVGWTSNGNSNGNSLDVKPPTPAKRKASAPKKINKAATSPGKYENHGSRFGDEEEDSDGEPVKKKVKTPGKKTNGGAKGKIKREILVSNSDSDTDEDDGIEVKDQVDGESIDDPIAEGDITI